MDDSEQTMLFQRSNKKSKNDQSSLELKNKESFAALPLALRVRPRKISGIIGQDHILGKKSLLPRLIQSDSFGSIIFYGPPGCGKTTLAEVIAHETSSRFIRVNAVAPCRVITKNEIINQNKINPDWEKETFKNKKQIDLGEQTNRI